MPAEGARNNVMRQVNAKPEERFNTMRFDSNRSDHDLLPQAFRYQHDPVQTTKTSVHGAINMLGLAKRVKAKILQASTSEVYGKPKVRPQTEDYWGNVNPIKACNRCHCKKTARRLYCGEDASPVR